MKTEVAKFTGTLSYKTRTGFSSKATYTLADPMVWDMLNLLADEDLDTVIAAVNAQKKVRKDSALTLEQVGP